MNSRQFNEALEMLRKAPRKVEVLKYLLAGYTNDEIAQSRGRAEGTVRKQISNVYKDFGIKSEFPGDRPLRDKLKALFLKYKPEWVSNCSPAITNEASNQPQKINYDGVTSLALSGDEIVEESGEELMFLAINILEALGFEQKFKMNKASRCIGYRLKNPGERDKRYQLFLKQSLDALSISINKLILDPYLLNFHYWVDLPHIFFEKTAGRFLVLPGKADLFLDSLNPKYWNILEIERKTIGNYYLSERPNLEMYDHITNDLSTICLDGFSEYNLSDSKSYLCIWEDKEFDYTWQMFIDSREVLEEIIRYFGRILLDMDWNQVSDDIDIPF
ncbi:MAG: helix-turn-helix transcriptional regulator [Nostoc sp. DedQUE08]|uniref:helix-turn-helix domain-containing protein n=1 Tax=unclassified Nostoc TaxID=2593658 RepID=UPI002AD3E0A0|nr:MULTISPECIES: helix-turn-helix transcriptional regulator [unclassified Nostoc]MDZ8033559.1 helix-turn-helix transcriptional regulator [Nostoc sp. DedSLP04]MDZ8069378.1 helix-turn-helix transcriptional regulator [Nostoc sp. DedQUE08]MDZ8094544.1 helix-turn-helix transcriptional regulator [Nostoc sp. DedQUE05]